MVGKVPVDFGPLLILSVAATFFLVAHARPTRAHAAAHLHCLGVMSIFVFLAIYYVPVWLMAMKASTPHQMYKVGKMYQARDIFPNMGAAARWYEAAAERGHADAQYWVGLCYASGWGVRKDISRGRSWLERAAAQGQEHAIRDLRQPANLYVNDFRWIEDSGARLRYYRDEAEHRNPIAQYELGVAFLRGDITERSHEQALLWLQHSAAQNYAPAQYQLGKALVEAGDREQGIWWLRRSARQGHRPAVEFVGDGSDGL